MSKIEIELITDENETTEFFAIVSSKRRVGIPRRIAVNRGDLVRVRVEQVIEQSDEVE